MNLKNITNRCCILKNAVKYVHRTAVEVKAVGIKIQNTLLRALDVSIRYYEYTCHLVGIEKNHLKNVFNTTATEFPLILYT